ncbi:MAG: M48 family metallopeptidase [Spirochaetales bacterium]
MSTQRVRLEAIAPRAWEHPADKAAFSLLRGIPGLPEFLSNMGGLTTDRALRLHWLGSSLRATPLQFPQLHAAVAEACRVLDVSPVPEVFVAPGLGLNAMAVGFDQPFLVVSSGLYRELTEDELLAVLGHELAHIKAGHMVYRTVLWLLTNVSLSLAQASQWVRLPLVAALKDWERKSELSCDRAGALVCQNPEAARRALLRIAYPGQESLLDEAEVLKQAADYDAAPDLLDSLYKVLNVLELSHPLLVPRVAELERWSRDPAYAAILAGTYPREGEAAPNPATDAKEAFDDWKADLNRSADAGNQMLGKAVTEAERFLGNLFRP